MPTLNYNSTGAANVESSVSISMGATCYSAPIYVENFRSYGFEFIWASGSSPVGTLTLELSIGGTTWEDSGVTGLSVSGSSGSHLFNVTFPGGERFARIKYARTSGSATATGFFCGKARN